MRTEELATVCSYIAANWPAAPMTTGTLDVFELEVGPLDYQQTLAALRERFADEQFPPTPLRLRNAVVRGDVDLDVGALLDELLSAISRVGYASPEPVWSSPLLTEWVARRGGWAETCKATPARAAADASGIGAFSTWRAQARDDLRMLAASEGRVAVRHALGEGMPLAVEAPGSRFEQ